MIIEKWLHVRLTTKFYSWKINKKTEIQKKHALDGYGIFHEKSCLNFLNKDR